jgi:predicted MPP superfamily phosphohydrolase
MRGGITLFGRTRRRRQVSAGLLLVATALVVDAALVEPYAVTVTRHAVSANVKSPLTVLHLTDLHTHGFGARERRTVETLEEAHADLVVVTGDVVDGGDLEPARELFVRLHAPLGVWVVRGNWENWKPPPNEGAFFTSVGATLLLNEGRLVRSDVWLAGVDDPMSGTADMTAALRGAPPGATKIALLHSPAYFDEVAPSIDLAFAGHTHGGQVRAPFLGALWLPPGSGRFVEGWYTAANAKLYVSRGVGTSIAPVRFLCRPEIAVVTLTPR